jgi:serine/threonine-protein kinase
VTTERWQRLQSVFGSALELPPGGRAPYVTDACGADESLRAEVLSLLEAEATSGEFMSVPALDRLASAFAATGWTLQPGARIGAYTTLRLLGAGGAGEVWRARDERLGRDVAIKMLLPQLSANAAQLRRFAEEARAAGALNHPNVLTVYDVGEHRGQPFLVTECLEGRTLRERLGTGPLAAAEAITVALGTARGLAAAHARGIVHRDLKPENVFLPTSGGVKVLDFGIAKIRRPEQAPADARHTMSGAIVGTAGYLAPEQLSGAPADARADFFSLGVMLYEMLCGRHPFRGASTFATLHAILSADPPNVSAAASGTPRRLARIVMRLLQKSPDARFQSAADLIWALEETGNVAAPEPSTPTAADRRRVSRPAHWLAAAALGALLPLGGWWLLQSRTPTTTPPALTQFTWTLPAGTSLDSPPMVSPNGRHIAFVGRDAAGSRLFVRDLGALEARVVPGTDGARQPFWSADGVWLGFFAAGRLMKLEWPNGAPAPVAAAPEPRGGTLTSANTIVFAPDLVSSGLSRVDVDGGPVAPATVLEIARGDTSHWWPTALADGVHFVYFVRSLGAERRGIYLGRTDRPATPAVAPLFRADSGAVFAPLPDGTDGALFSTASGRLEIRRFDGRRLTVAPDARTLAFSPAPGTLYHPMLLSASADVLAFGATAVPAGNRMEAITRSGEPLRIWSEPEAQNWPRLSPGGGRVARQIIDDVRNNPDIWVEDLERGTRVRVTSTLEPDIQPVWAPDGRHLAYATGSLPGRTGGSVLNIAAADGTGIVRTLPCPGAYCEPTDWSPDGRRLLVNVGGGAADVWAVALDDSARTEPLLDEPFAERDARFSPDGNWVAYVADESGRAEVSIRTITGAPERIVVSADGGAQPVWRRDGRELYFVDPQGDLRSASVQWTSDGKPTFGLPVRLDVPPIGFGHWGTQYDVSPDGEHIYFLRRNDDPPPREINVVIGWSALL